MSRLIHTLRESGLCVDRVRLLEWITVRPWRRMLCFRFLRLRFSPDILDNARSQPGSAEGRGRLFSLAVSFLNIGRTYKTTGAGRTRLTDSAIAGFAQERGPVRVMEAAVSDGVGASDLLAQLPEGSTMLLTDRFPYLYRRRLGPIRVFLDSDRRLLGIKVFIFYLNVAPGPVRTGSGYESVDTVNPVVSSLPRVQGVEPFDVFTDTLSEPVDVIKCANLLGPSYFTPEAIRAAIGNLCRSLKPGGRLYVAHSHESYDAGEAWFALEKTESGLVLVEGADNHPAQALFEGS